MGSDGPRILFVGKRFYTNKDAFKERYGRIYQLPLHWAGSGGETKLWLIDYHSREVCSRSEAGLQVESTPALGAASLSALIRACWRWRPQLVVASGDCYIGLLGWIVSVLCRGRFAFDIYDKYDDFSAYRRPFGFDLFAFLRRRAACRFYASQTLLRALAGAPSAGDLVVANAVDERLFVPMDLDSCREQLQPGVGEARLIGYFGSMEPARGVQDLVEALALLRAAGTDVKLLLCGKPDAAVALQQEGVIYRGLVPYADVPRYINACDVVVLPYRQSSLLDHSASCKIAEYLMCRRPLVSTRTPNFMENFPRQAAAMDHALCAPDDVPALARALEWQLRERRSVEAPQELTWAAVSALALQALRRLIPGHGAA